MALSNIFKEPRREITESAVGVLAILSFLVGDWFFALWLNTTQDQQGNVCPIPLGLLLGVLAAGIVYCLGFMFVLGTHALGEAICNALERNGVRLRPVRR